MCPHYITAACQLVVVAPFEFGAARCGIGGKEEDGIVAAKFPDNPLNF